MERLSGTHDARVDDRYRVALPSRMLDAFAAIANQGVENPAEDIEIVVGLGLGKNVCVFPKNVHQNLLKFLDGQPSPHASWDTIRFFVTTSAETQTLDKQKRFRIPVKLAKKFRLTDEITVAGFNDHLELMSAETHEKSFDGYLENFDGIYAEACKSSGGRQAG